MQNMSSWNHISSMPHTGRQECILAPLCVNDSVLSFSIIIIRWFSCIPLKFRTFLVNETMKSDFAACQAPTLIRLANKINVASFIARSFMITSTKRSPVYAVGGGSRDARWGQMISDLLQSPPTSMMPCWQCAGLFIGLQRARWCFCSQASGTKRELIVQLLRGGNIYLKCLESRFLNVWTLTRRPRWCCAPTPEL